MDTVSSPDTSLYGNKYFLTILDDYTRYAWLYFIKSKADPFNTFIKWYKRVKNIFNHKLNKSDPMMELSFVITSSTSSMTKMA